MDIFAQNLSTLQDPNGPTLAKLQQTFMGQDPTASTQPAPPQAPALSEQATPPKVDEAQKQMVNPPVPSDLASLRERKEAPSSAVAATTPATGSGTVPSNQQRPAMPPTPPAASATAPAGGEGVTLDPYSASRGVPALSAAQVQEHFKSNPADLRQASAFTDMAKAIMVRFSEGRATQSDVAMMGTGAIIPAATQTIQKTNEMLWSIAAKNGIDDPFTRDYLNTFSVMDYMAAQKMQIDQTIPGAMKDYDPNYVKNLNSCMETFRKMPVFAQQNMQAIAANMQPFVSNTIQTGQALYNSKLQYHVSMTEAETHWYSAGTQRMVGEAQVAMTQENILKSQSERQMIAAQIVDMDRKFGLNSMLIGAQSELIHNQATHQAIVNSIAPMEAAYKFRGMEDEHQINRLNVCQANVQAMGTELAAARQTLTNKAKQPHRNPQTGKWEGDAEGVHAQEVIDRLQGRFYVASDAYLKQCEDVSKSMGSKFYLPPMVRSLVNTAAHPNLNGSLPTVDWVKSNMPGGFKAAQIMYGIGVPQTWNNKLRQFVPVKDMIDAGNVLPTNEELNIANWTIKTIQAAKQQNAPVPPPPTMQEYLAQRQAAGFPTNNLPDQGYQHAVLVYQNMVKRQELINQSRAKGFSYYGNQPVSGAAGPQWSK